MSLQKALLQLLCALSILSLAACGGGGSDSSNTSDGTSGVVIPKPKPRIELVAKANPDAQHIQTLLKAIENNYGIKTYMEINMNKLPSFSWPISSSSIAESDYKKVQTFLLLFDEEFKKYPWKFLKKTNLKGVAFTKNMKLTSNGWVRGAIPDYYKEILLLDFLAGAFDKTYQRHVVHHEFYHMIEEEFHGDSFYKDPAWNALNLAGTNYGNGGAAVQGLNNQYEYVHPATGFVNRYAQSAINEDKAEMYATLFITSQYNKTKDWINNGDTVLAKKKNYMQTFLRGIDSKFDDNYWQTTHN